MNSPQASAIPAVAADVAEALAFLAPIMRPSNPSCLGPEYPLVYEMSGRGGARLVREQGKILSGAVYAPFDAVTQPATSLRVGAIGSVGTDPAERGKGYARRAVAACEEALREQGCSVALLWSQVPEVFRKIGYTDAGVEVVFSIEQGDLVQVPRPAGVVVPFDAERDLASCLALYERQPARVQRTAEEFRRQMKIPGMEVWVHRRLGKATAYGAIGKGTDFPETMHEWAGSVEGVAAILWHYLPQNQREGMTLICSGSRPDMVAAMKGWGIEPLHGVMGLWKALDPQRLLDSVRSAMESHGLRARYQHGGYQVEGSANAMTFDETRFLRFLFGYRGITGDHLEAARLLGATALKDAPVIHAYFWGLDSI